MYKVDMKQKLILVLVQVPTIKKRQVQFRIIIISFLISVSGARVLEKRGYYSHPLMMTLRSRLSLSVFTGLKIALLGDTLFVYSRILPEMTRCSAKKSI